MTLKYKYKDFIGAYQDVYPEGYCEHLISEFERLAESGAGFNRRQSDNMAKHCKSDFQMCLNLGAHSVAPFDNMSVQNLFFEGLQQGFNHYTEEYSTLQNDRLVASDMKMQKTNPGDGYHLWHSEQGAGAFASRALVYSLYLNDVEETHGGETEFLYQKLRVRPEKNTLLIWPAAFTHTHRGNTVLGDKAKYIVTGWFYYE